MGCVRILLSPIAFLFGAVAMAVVVFLGFALALAALGASSCYREDTWRANETFAAILLGVNLLAAMVGGAVARKTGSILAVLFLAVFAATVSTVPHLDSPFDATKSQRFAGRPAMRPADAQISDLTRWTEYPDWVRYAGALVGVTGVFFGSAIAKNATGSRKPSRGRDADG